MKRPILRMVASSHKTPIVNGPDSRLINPASKYPRMATGALVLRLDDDSAVGRSSGGVNDLVVMASAFGASHGSLLTGFFD